ncbi:helix-turn-helix domain-containing protein [Comamonas endophytica]|uniref:Helix-turn-helix domain-containing protein n=2 Tax=Comamonas endophytica TaxID=2949090 RepID=A0ABY6GI16_9BURK|nr:helix-turn-helix domain-containing protein [Acidovorax sp. 5MLIR]UYG53935.1 helix-turn-helix domain-containing protein [Acidovorax sp. 5MLIR]
MPDTRCHRLQKSPVPVVVQRELASLATRAAVVRKARHLTQADLAHLADVGISTVAAVEGGHDGVSIGNLLKLMSALGVLEQTGKLFELQADPGLVDYARERLQPPPLAERPHVVRREPDA